MKVFSVFLAFSLSFYGFVPLALSAPRVGNGDSQVSFVTLQCGDGGSVTVATDVARCSQVLQDLLELPFTESESSTNSSVAIPLSKIKTEILLKVMDYCEHHSNGNIQQQPNPQNSTKNSLELWDEAFMTDLSITTLIDVTLSANYLDIQDLLNLATKTIANRIKGKSVEEIRTILLPVNQANDVL